MRKNSRVLVVFLAWAFSAPARAQQPPAPPAAPPAPPSNQPATPPVASEPPGAAAPAPQVPMPQAPSGPAPEPAPAPAPEPATVPQPALEPEPGGAPAASIQPLHPALTNPEATEHRARTEAGTADLASKPLLGLALGTPDTGAMPGRFRPAYGIAPKTARDFRFDFHGYLTVPLRVGLNERTRALKTQHKAVLHGPPLVPDDFERFEHTGVVPQPWVQLGFSYGNSVAVANVIIAARGVSNAAGYFNPPTQLGINDAFITFKPEVRGFGLEIDVGGFANRYGSMGDYDTGRYDTPVIARVGGVGETVRFNVPLAHELVFLAEHGLMGQWDRAPLGVEPAGWNSFADSNVGTSFAHHAHLGIARFETGQAGLHYVTAFTQDDRTAPSQADGSITVLGADVNAELAPFGRLYLAAAYTSADQARGVSPVIRVLNTSGGPGLMREYLGPASGGTGSLTTLGLQYDVSVGEILRGTERFSGYAPDVFASLFGMYTHVESDDTRFDGVDKVKYGGELTYSALSWLAVSGRYDRVVANTEVSSRTFAVLSPRVIFRTDYNSQDQITLQYSRWFYGSGVVVRNSYAPCTPSLLGSSPEVACGDPSLVPDGDTFSLAASMWW